MRLYYVIIATQIFGVYTVSKIFVPNSDECLTVASANIVDECFGFTERWSDLLVIPDQASNEILAKIHHESKNSISILSLDGSEYDEDTEAGKNNEYSNYISLEWQGTKTTAVVIVISNLKQLKSVLGSLKQDFQTVWRPESYFLIVLKTKCNEVECNRIFKLIWGYWILSAVILCSSDDPANLNGSKIELYTFNPYSADHSRHWKIIIHETVEVSIDPRSFNHSWYVFKKNYTEIRSFEDCGDLFFDKTLNLDGYVIPIGSSDPEFLTNTTKSSLAAWYAQDTRGFKTLASLLRFNFVQVCNDGPQPYGQPLKNGTYTGRMGDLYDGRTHLIPNMRSIRPFPGLEMIYPHDITGVCFASWNAGSRPQWMNLANAKYIWIALGLGTLFSTLVIYFQNNSKDIVAAFLDAERLIIGSSMISRSTVVKHRILLGSIFLVVLVVDGAIRGRFISILTVVTANPNLDTLEQLREDSVDLYGSDRYKGLIPDVHLQSKFNNSLAFPECLKSSERGHRRRACFAECRYLHFMKANLSDIHIASTPILTFHVVLLATLHWPLANRYSFGVQKLVESSIFKKWQLDIEWELEVNGWKVKRTEEPPYVKPTRLNDLLPAFMLLFMGLLTALIVFVWEMVNFKS